MPLWLNLDVQGNISLDGYEINKITGHPSASRKKVKQSVTECELFGKHLSSVLRLHTYLDRHAKHPYRCQWCGEIYLLYIYNRHMLSKHLNQQYTCGECGKNFLIRTSWYNHQKMHRNIIYKCKEQTCSYTFRSESWFQEHAKYFHKPTKTVKCKQSNKFFQTLSHRNNHKKK